MKSVGLTTVFFVALYCEASLGAPAPLPKRSDPFPAIYWKTESGQQVVELWFYPDHRYREIWLGDLYEGTWSVVNNKIKVDCHTVSNIYERRFFLTFERDGVNLSLRGCSIIFVGVK